MENTDFHSNLYQNMHLEDLMFWIEELVCE